MKKRYFNLSLVALLSAALASGVWTSVASAAVTQISAGQYHTCAVKSDGSVACWGRNDEFQSTPADGAYTQVSASYTHTCGLKTDGNIVCWGESSAQRTPTGGSFTQVVSGYSSSCGLREDSSMICTNSNLAIDGVLSYISASQYYYSFGISSYYDYTCAIKTDDSIACGRSSYPEPLPSSSLTFKQISSGSKHACGVRTSGGLVCWGDNDYNQTMSQSGTFSQVSAGYRHSCAVKTDGGVICWGDNSDGQAVPPSGTFTQVSAGRSHSCGLKTDGSVVCWGDNSTGQTTLPTDLNSDVTVTPTPTTYTQAELDAAVEAAVQACVSDPASCGITTSTGGYTQAQLDAAVLQAKQACASNPASCGIIPSDGGPSAYYDATRRLVEIPALRWGNEIYQATLGLDLSIPGKIMFDLTSLSKDGNIVLGQQPAPVLSNAQISATKVKAGDSVNLTWQSNYQEWFLVYIYKTQCGAQDSQTSPGLTDPNYVPCSEPADPLNTAGFLSYKCVAAQEQTGIDTAAQGCLWSEHNTALSKSQSWRWTVPAELPSGQYRLKVAVWNSADQSSGGFSGAFTVE
jgi:hypothetical protein